ncbi:MAG: ATP-binding protein [Chthoniobacterales bacterium]
MHPDPNYYFRPLEKSLKEALCDTPVVCILGPRQCGKSTLARHFGSNYSYVNLDEEETLRAALGDPTGFVNALSEYAILDEVQHAPDLLRALKVVVDKKRTPGRFLLTGSANLLLLPQLSDSLAGRMEIIQLQTLSEAEKERAPGDFLRIFLEGKLKSKIQGEEKSDSPSLQERIVAGGYPEPLTRSPARARQWHRHYLKSIIERDVQTIANVRDVHQLSLLLEMLALSTAQLVNTLQLSRALRLDRKTIDHYLSILERLFLIRSLPSWHNNEGKRLQKTSKIHLLDSGLTATLAGLNATDWIARRERFGHLLESFVVQQFITQAGWTDPDLRFWHYRDHDHVEVDLVITRGKETWGVEVKAAASLSKSDGKGLRRLAGLCGKNFRGGIILYNGNNTFQMEDKRFFSVPLKRLWNC